MQHTRRKFICNTAKITAGAAFTTSIVAPLLYRPIHDVAQYKKPTAATNA